MEESEHVRVELQELNSESGTDAFGEKGKRRRFEKDLRVTLMKGRFYEIQNKVTPRTLTMCETNGLLMAMEVNYSLRRLVENKSPEKDDFTKLSNSVDEFMSCLLDPLKSNYRCRNLLRGCLDDVVDTAIELEQKKILSHPVISNLMKAKWCGRFGRMKRFSWLELPRWKWLFLNIWCLFDMVLFPVLFLVLFLLRVVKRDSSSKRRSKKDAFECYLEYFTTPYFVFNRDTLSYLTLLGLHVAICLEPTSVKFSCLEWCILVFFMGRTLMESKQFCDTTVRLQRSSGQGMHRPRASQYASVSDNEESELIQHGHFSNQEISASTGDRRPCCCKVGTVVVLKKFEKYLSDRWNALDFITLVIYASTFILRVFTWITSETAINNRALISSGYLYGLNTMFLTLRAFGHVMEATKRLGTVQIALFRIMKEVIAILWQFLATILAFSIAITKVYVAESSYVTEETQGRNSACSISALTCWWTMVKHLCWSLLGIPDLGPFDSVDHPSVTLAHFMYGAFMIMGVILLINMMIALLSNTYQQVEDNALKEWSFKKAVTIQTYSAYHPVPVPFNLMSNLVMLLWYFWCKCKRLCSDQTPTSGSELTKNSDLDIVVKELQMEYFAEQGYSFPLTDERKLDQLVFETEKNRQLANRIAQCTFVSDGITHDCLPVGSKAWSSIGIKVEGCLLVYEGPDNCDICKEEPSSKPRLHHGARYNSPFSRRFPHFEVLIQEIGHLRFLNVGIVRQHHNLHSTPGRNSGGVAFYADGFKGIANAGSVLKNKKFEANVACRGDLIACTVMFEMAANGKVPIVFTVNEQRITDEEIMMDYNQVDQMLYPFVGMGEEGVRVLARMSASKNAYYEDLSHRTDGIRQCEEVTFDLHNDVQQNGDVTIRSPVETRAIETIYRDLDQVCLEFRRLREQMFRNFTKFEDLFSDWHKGCLKIGSLAPQQDQIEHDKYKQELTNTDLLQKMKETLEELGELTRDKCGILFKQITEITGDSSKQHIGNGQATREMRCEN